MIVVAIALALQAPAPEGFTPEEETAVLATMDCLKRYVDSRPRRERRQRGEALVEEAYGACAEEEGALRALLRSRFNERSADEVMEMVRTISRDGMQRYIRR